LSAASGEIGVRRREFLALAALALPLARCAAPRRPVAAIPPPAPRRGVYYVTDLGDDQRQGQLRAGIERGAREIRFREAGDPIRLRGTLKISRPVLISDAGAPALPVIDGTVRTSGPGIAFRGLGFHNSRKDPHQDCLMIASGSRDVTVEHCSFLGGTDEQVDVNGGARDRPAPDRIVFKWNTFFEPKRTPARAGGFRPYCMLIAQRVERVWVYGNWFSSGTVRMPRSLADWTSIACNVVYNQTNHGITLLDNKRQERGPTRGNVCRNVFIAGPTTRAKIRASGGRRYPEIRFWDYGGPGFGDWYVADNIGVGGRRAAVMGTQRVRLAREPVGPIAPPGESLLDADEVYEAVVERAGPRLPHPEFERARRKVIERVATAVFLP
jgi:hypothetical protein